MHRHKEGDRVEVTYPDDEKGMQGYVVTAGPVECIVRITKAGDSHNTVRKIGQKLPYFHTELKGI